MNIRTAYLIIFSLLLSFGSCLLFIARAGQLYSDSDYVHNYLKCPPDADSEAIPIAGSIIISLIFGGLHSLTHLVFFLLHRDEKNKVTKLQPFFYKNEPISAWIIKILFYSLGMYLLWDYYMGYYKPYLFEFASAISQIFVCVVYAQLLTRLYSMPQRA